MHDDNVIDNKAVLKILTGSVIFFLIGTFAGMLGRIAVSTPGFMENVTFYRIVTHHPLVLVVGWASFAVMGIVHYSIPKVSGKPIYSGITANATMWLTVISTIMLIIAMIPGLNGSTARYSALPPLYHPFFPTMLALCVCLTGVIFYGANILKTFLTLPEDKAPHTSCWYFTMSAVLGTLFLGMAGVPLLLQSLAGLYQNAGVDYAWALDPLVNKHLIWWGLHSYVNQMINIAVLGMLYVIIPMNVKKGIYSEKGATWGLFLYIIVNNVAYFHHLLMDPLPMWQKVAGQVGTWFLGLTTALSVYNLMKTASGGEKWGIPMKFIIGGLIGFIIEGSIGIFHSTLPVNLFAHNTQAILGYVHAVFYGYISMCLLGVIYTLIPEVRGVPLYSQKLGNIHFWATVFNLTGMVIVLQVAGYSGMPRNVQVIDPYFQPHMALATAFAVGLFTATAIGGYNLIMTAVYCPDKKAASATVGAAAAAH